MKTLAILTGFLIGFSVYGQEGSWTILKMELPINETFEAGTKVICVIEYDNHTLVDYSNLSDTPARIIFHVSESGVRVPDERIGPVRFRTKDLAPGEKSQMTYNWERGQEITFEITGGKVLMEVKPE